MILKLHLIPPTNYIQLHIVTYVAIRIHMGSDFLKLVTVIYDNVWATMVAYGYMVFSDLQINLRSHDSVWVNMAAYDYIWAC